MSSSLIGCPIHSALCHIEAKSFVNYYYKFEKLGQEGQTIKEGLIQLRLIEAMYNAWYWYNIMEQTQIGNMSLNTCIDFIRQQKLIQKYNHDKSQPSEQIFADTYMLKKIKCSYCERVHEIKRENCSAFGKNCTNCLKRTIFQAVCKFKKKNVERVEENETNMQVFLVKNKNRNVEKIERKKKDIALKVKINNFD